MQTRTKTRHSKYYTRDFKPFAGIRNWKKTFNKESDQPSTESQKDIIDLSPRQVSYSQKLNSLRLEGVKKINLDSQVSNPESKPLIKTIVNRPKLKENSFEITESIHNTKQIPKTFTNSDEFKILRESQLKDSQKPVKMSLGEKLASPFKWVGRMFKNIYKACQKVYQWVTSLILRISNRLGKVGTSGFQVVTAISKFVIEVLALFWAVIRMFGYIFTESGKAFLFIFGLRRQSLISKQDRKSSNHPKKVVAN
jgi:hypothetical protein